MFRIGMAILVACFGFASPGTAGEPSPAALKLVKAMHSKEMFKLAFSPMEAMMQKLEKDGCPAEELAKMRGMMDDFAGKMHADPEILSKIAAVYQEHFTEEEINQMTAFFESPVGRKFTASQVQVTEETNKELAPVTTEFMTAMSKAVRTMLAEHMMRKVEEDDAAFMKELDEEEAAKKAKSAGKDGQEE